jgi:hypothetical protein
MSSGVAFDGWVHQTIVMVNAPLVLLGFAHGKPYRDRS